MSIIRDRHVAIVRFVSDSLSRCELTHIERQEINVCLAVRQHGEYVSKLKALGAEIKHVESLHNQPDAVFVEDTAIVLPELAIITRPGAVSRRRETESVACVLGQYRPLFHVLKPGLIDGGDVLVIGKTLYVAESPRTNWQGIRQLRQAVEALDYRIKIVDLGGALHLKTAVTFIPPDLIVHNPQWVRHSAFTRFRCIAVDESEPFAANTLTVDHVTLMTADSPRTIEKLDKLDICVQSIDISEFQRAEAGLTCLSLMVPCY